MLSYVRATVGITFFEALTVLSDYYSQAADIAWRFQCTVVEPDHASSSCIEKIQGLLKQTNHFIGSEQAGRHKSIVEELQRTVIANQLAPDEYQIAQKALAPIQSQVLSGARSSISWDRRLFLQGDNHSARVGEMIEVAGNPRCIFFGPYLTVPAGAWNVRCVFGFSNELREIPFVLEFYSSRVLGGGYFYVPRGGIYACSFKLSTKLQGASKQLMHSQLRMIMFDTAIDGQVSLIDVKLQPIEEHEEQKRGQ